MQLRDIDDADIKRTLDKLSNRPSERLHVFRYTHARLAAMLAKAGIHDADAAYLFYARNP
jgi:hypothetical protein